MDPPRGNPLEDTLGPRPSGPRPAAADSGDGGQGTESPVNARRGAVGHSTSGCTTRPPQGLGPDSEDEDPAAVGRFVHVYVDAVTRKVVPVPQAIRDLVSSLPSAPQEAT